MIEAIEFSSFGQMVRSSIWIYPVANILHVLGAALLLGSIVVFDVYLLQGRYGVAAGIAPVALSIAAFGVVLQLLSGLVLFSAEATALARNPIFLVKMALIVAALANVAFYHARNRAGAGDAPPGAGLQALVSAGLWLSAVVAGRSIAYF